MHDHARGVLLTFALVAAACGDGESDLVGPQAHDDGALGELVSFDVVSAGYAHTCALSDEGVAYCWGSNVGGALGDGTTTDRLTPTEVGGDRLFTTIGVGEHHTCGLGTDGVAYCWGVDPLTVGRGPVRFDSLPRAVAGGQTFASLTVGTLHTCALDRDGAAWCWGVNENGRLGDSTHVGRDAPTPVRGGHRFRALEAGDATCGIEQDGTLYCWGRSPSDCECTVVPQVQGAGYAFATITVAGHVCAIDAAGEPYCWGENIWGQIGDGSNTNRPDPVRVAGGLRFSAISAARFSTCALDGDGAAYCWGSNPFGQIGDGTRGTEWDVPVAVAGGHQFRSISAGANHTCAVDGSGAAWCWGWNAFGQLGDGTVEDRVEPEVVGGSGPELA